MTAVKACMYKYLIYEILLIIVFLFLNPAEKVLIIENTEI